MKIRTKLSQLKAQNAEISHCTTIPCDPHSTSTWIWRIHLSCFIFFYEVLVMHSTQQKPNSHSQKSLSLSLPSFQEDSNPPFDLCVSTALQFLEQMHKILMIFGLPWQSCKLMDEYSHSEILDGASQLLVHETDHLALEPSPGHVHDLSLLRQCFCFLSYHPMTYPRKFPCNWLAKACDNARTRTCEENRKNLDA